jgi:hypothetical protein
MDKVIAAKAGLAVLCALAGVILARWGPVQGWSRQGFDRRLLLAVLISRAGLAVVLGVALGGVSSDLANYYKWTSDLMHGARLGTDVPLHYAPLFHYLLMPVLWVWDSPWAIVAVNIGLELASIPLWMRSGRAVAGERTVRLAAVLYATSPIFMTGCAGGLNNVALSLCLAGSVSLLLSGRALASGLVFSVSVIAVKFLNLVHAPVLWVCTGRRAWWTVGLALPPAIVYGLWWWLGPDPFEGMKYHAQHASSGNLPYLLGLVGFDSLSESGRRAANLGGLAALAGVFLLPLLRRRWYSRDDLMPLLSAVLMTLMLASRKSFPHYVMIAFFPVCMVFAGNALDWRRLGMFFLWGLVASVESSMWYRWLGQSELTGISATALPAGVTSGRLAAFLAVEGALIGVYGWALGLSVAWMFRRGGTPDAACGTPRTG